MRLIFYAPPFRKYFNALSIGLVGVIYKPELFINTNSDHSTEKEALVVHNELDPR